MFYNNIDPVFLHIGPFYIRYYGLIFALGLFFSFMILRSLARKRQLPLTNRDFDELLLLISLGVVVGARLGAVLSNLSYYASNPSQIIAVWNGGMAFHGGFAGLVLVGYFFAKKKKISFYDLADIAVIPAALALAFGRVANFINGEFYGAVTSLPWGVKFQGVDGFRHPVQIYEAIKNFLIFAVLWQLRNKALPKGFLFWLFVFLYGAIRFPLEYLKVVPKFAFGLTWGQVWCIPMVIVGAFMLWKIFSHKKVAALAAVPERKA